MTREPVDPPSTDGVRVEQSAAGVVIEVTVAAPIDTVWRHLREPELIRRWHGWEFDGLDGEIDFVYREHAREGADPYVLETEGGPAPGSFELGDRFDLREDEAGSTVVRITRGPKGTDEVWESMYDDITEGWTSFLAQLRFVLETHPDALRRTVFLASDGSSTPVRDQLGVSDLPPGGYRLQPATGLDLVGSMWFRTDRQVGLTVDSYGPGLIVVADTGGTADAGAGGTSMIIVSTYGLSEDAHAGIEAAWQQWWADRPGPAAG